MILVTCAIVLYLVILCEHILLCCFLFVVCFYLCKRVDNVSFERNQEQVYEEENQQFGKEGKWTSLPVYSILSQ